MRLSKDIARSMRLVEQQTGIIMCNEAQNVGKFAIGGLIGGYCRYRQ